MLTIDVTLHFPERFIAHPYWPETDRVINIQKKSGVNRAKTEENRRKALEGYLKKIDMDMDDYERMLVLAARPFHINGEGKIILPAEQMASFLANANDKAPAALRACKSENTRSMMRFSDFVTEKSQPDGVWERFAVVTSGGGAKLSNQRSLRANEYIEDFTATGEVLIDPNQIDHDTLRTLIEWGGTWVGIGASRPMGFGRFQVREWKPGAMPEKAKDVGPDGLPKARKTPKKGTRAA